MSSTSFVGVRCGRLEEFAENEFTDQGWSSDADGWRTPSLPSVGSQHRRFRRLTVAFKPMREAFVDLAELIDEFVGSVPLRPHEDEATDRERFVGWLCTHYGLTDEQRRRFDAASEVAIAV